MSHYNYCDSVPYIHMQLCRISDWPKTTFWLDGGELYNLFKFSFFQSIKGASYILWNIWTYKPVHNYKLTSMNLTSMLSIPSASKRETLQEWEGIHNTWIPPFIYQVFQQLWNKQKVWGDNSDTPVKRIQ